MLTIFIPEKGFLQLDIMELAAYTADFAPSKEDDKDTPMKKGMYFHIHKKMRNPEKHTRSDRMRGKQCLDTRKTRGESGANRLMKSKKANESFMDGVNDDDNITMEQALNAGDAYMDGLKAYDRLIGVMEFRIEELKNLLAEKKAELEKVKAEREEYVMSR